MHRNEQSVGSARMEVPRVLGAQRANVYIVPAKGETLLLMLC